MINKILVVGGTGMLGRPVVNRFRSDGYSIRLMTHTPDRARMFFGDEIETTVADVTDFGSLPEAINGCDGVYINLSAKMDNEKYETLERQGTINIANAAVKGGIQRISMISGLNVNEFDTKHPFIAAKYQAEKALVDSGIPYTIFRCSWFFESLPLFVQGKKAILLGKQPHPFSWLAASDYAGLVSKSFATDDAANRIFFVKGIEKMTIPVALTRFCDIVAPEAALSPIPFWLTSLATLFSRKGKTRGLVDFMKYFDKHPEPETNRDAEEILGPCLTTLQDWAEEYKRKLQKD